MNPSLYLRNWIVPVVFIGIYVLLPNRNPGNDAWAYASAAKWGEELFSPHHLFYNVPGWIWGKVFGGWKVMEFMQGLNALAAGICLTLCGGLIANRGASNRVVGLVQALIGSTFVVFHYATENEAYLLPMVFSLMGLGLVQASGVEVSTRRLLCSGILLAMATLFHQQHLLSLIAGFGFLMFWGKTSRVNLIGYFLLPALSLIAALYVFAWQMEPMLANPFQYFFHDFYTGSARWVAGSKHWLLGPVNLIRIFVYVHGDILGIFKHHGFLGITGLVGGVLMMLALGMVLKKYILSIRGNLNVPIEGRRLNLISGKTFSGIFPRMFEWVSQLGPRLGIWGFVGLGHLGFALWFGANHEFMVPLPFLLGIVLGARVVCYHKPAFIWGLSGMMIWNLVFSGFTQRFFTTDPSVSLAQMVQQYPQALWVLYDESRIRHILKYYSGEEPHNLLHGPEWYAETGREVTELSEIIREALNRDYAVYSDCPNRPRPWNRASMTRVDSQDYWQNWETGFVMSIETLTHKYPVFRILPARADNQVFP